MKRMTYKKVCYRESASSPKNCPKQKEDKYIVQYAVWKCPEANGKNGAVRSGCQGLTLPERSIEQSFMEMLYQLRWDYLRRGEESDIARGFFRLCQSIPAQRRNSGFWQQQLRLMDLELEEMRQERKEISGEAQHCLALMERYPSQSMEYSRYASTCAQYRLRIDDLTKSMDEKANERESMRQSFDRIDGMRRNYEAFLEELQTLPDISPTGFDMGTGETHIEHQAAKYNAVAWTADEPLKFDERIFRSFVVSVKAAGDTIYYGMSFGLILSSAGNSRKFRMSEGEK